MQQIEEWLEKLGMSAYARQFVENRIDISVLGDLNDEDLRELGSSSVIARRSCVRSANFMPLDPPPPRQRNRCPTPPNGVN